jgi:dTDP-glucose 4,6-dehydratase
VRVLLTGAAGFLGSHALRHLLTNTDWEIICPVSFRHKGMPERIVSSTDNDDPETHIAWIKRTQLVWCDLASPLGKATSRLIGDIDYIINYASESHVDRSIVDPVPFIQNNVNVVLNVLEFAREQTQAGNLKAFVQVSTDEVYGPAPDDYAHVEWDPLIPSNPYAASKAAQESIAVSYWRTYGIPLIITNCMNLIGEMQDPEKFVPMVASKIRNGEVVPIHASQDDEGVGVQIGSRFYLHARNLADAILFLLKNITPVMYGDVYGNSSPLGDAEDEPVDRPDKFHIVGEREIDNLEMAQLIASFVGKDLKYNFVDFHRTRPGHDRRYALNAAKIERLGWKPPVPLDESLDRAIKWTAAHPVWSRHSE